MQDSTYSHDLDISICAITILRIRALYDLDLNDITYSIAPMGLFTLLEPTLGIINACLPVIQPILHKCLQSRVFSRGQSATKHSHTSLEAQNTQEGGGGHKAKKFHRLDDHTYPLAETYGNFNEVATPENDTDLEERDVGSLNLERSIFVERRWDVRLSA